MAIPISYNVRSVGARWATALVSILGIAVEVARPWPVKVVIDQVILPEM